MGASRSHSEYLGLAERALAGYGIGDCEAEFLKHSENITFCVTSSEQGQFLLRIHLPVMGIQDSVWVQPEVIRSELMWLEALACQTDLRVQKPVRNRAGDLIAEIDDEGDARFCTLLGWIEGEHIKRYTDVYAEQMGVLVAHLEAHARRWTPPTGFIRPRWDWTRLQRRSLRGLKKGVEIGTISSSLYRAYDVALNRIRPVMDVLGEDSDVWGLIHADLHRGNFLIHGDELRPIDFSLCCFGHYLYGIAGAIFYIPSKFHGAFIRGYQSLFSLPEGALPILEALFVGELISNRSFLALNPIDFDHMSKKVQTNPNEVDTQVLKFLDGESFLDF